MSRTTLDIDPHVLEELKHMAAEQGTSMSKVASRLLRDALQRDRAPDAAGASLRWHAAEGGKPAPGFDPATRDYLDLLDDG
jgi:hypothetical protein